MSLVRLEMVLLSASVLGGNTPYSYSLNGGPSTTNNSFNNLSAGNYTVDVTRQ